MTSFILKIPVLCSNIGSIGVPLVSSLKQVHSSKPTPPLPLFLLSFLSLFATAREYSSFFAVFFRELEPSATTCKLDSVDLYTDHFVLASKPFDDLRWHFSCLDHNEFHGHHAVAMNHSYPAYVAPGPASTPRTSDNTNNADDHPWNSHHSTDHFHQLSVAPHYHHHHSTSFSLPGGAHVVDGEIDSSAARGISHPHPFLFSYRLASRAPYCSQ